MAVLTNNLISCCAFEVEDPTDQLQWHLVNVRWEIVLHILPIHRSAMHYVLHLDIHYLNEGQL